MAVLGLACGELARYSTDIAAAWLVVEKMREQKCGVAIDWQISTPNCVVVNMYQPLRDIDVEICAETAPFAICRAALAALETP
jgi:hypothetical protein